MYLSLNKKYEHHHMIKTFRVIVENQLNPKTKVIGSDMSHVHYGRYMNAGESPLFWNFVNIMG